ncbi:hypothetical protein ASG43_18275 [Aureimonas sp. Leaf454]|uniref:glycosyltransferase family 4 protein n=1 Tax=Aureimonas sp. Leaf454 TaxID=1736381 RepID=UPI0006F2D9CB|nr:glycosyltransferase family 4 protein [Aureimonas sp. Leaf454]KQT53773.1 hypothetical protein ASG43_18275 [Aureimonas sp. Leaf454]
MIAEGETGLPRHVLMTADAVGGVWTYAVDVANGLFERGIRVTIAILGPSPDMAQRMSVERTGLALVEAGMPLDWADDATPDSLAAAGARLAALARELGADLLHLNAPMLAADAVFAVPVVGVCHSCVATWWDAVRGGKLPEMFEWRAERLGRAYRRCDLLVSPSRAFASATRARYGVPVTTVLNGRSASAHRSADRRSVAMTSGRLWDEGKGIATLDAAAGRMHHKIEAAGAVRGPHGTSIETRHLGHLGHLPGAVLADRLAASRVYVSAARYEPFGLGVLEAAQAGCALVLSDIPTFRELWAGAAVFVDPLDETAFADTLDDLLDDPGRSAELGAAAAQRAKRYGLETMVDGTLDAYRHALRSSGRGRGAAA